MASTRKPAAKRKATKVAQSMPIDPKKHKEVNKGAKIYNQRKGYVPKKNWSAASPSQAHYKEEVRLMGCPRPWH